MGRCPLYLPSFQLVAMHLVGEPPSLTAQFIPLALPGLTSSTPEPAHPSGPLADWSWDPRGERLAVVLGGAAHPARGCLAVFATTTDPVVNARLIGYARPPPVVPGDEAVRSEIEAWRLSPHMAFERGALFTLSLCSHEHYNLPLYNV